MTRAPRVPAAPAVIAEADLRRFFTDAAALMALASAPLPAVASPPPVDLREVERFFAAVSRQMAVAEVRQQVTDRIQAPRFNVFDLIDPDENKLSDVLAELLDPHGRHGQGERFLHQFLARLGFEVSAFVGRPVKVQREAVTDTLGKARRRIDLLIDAGPLVAIENKVDSMEQEDQVKDYLAHLDTLCHERNVPGTLIYLTPNGRQPKSLTPDERGAQRARKRLHVWSYQDEIRTWLADCRAACEAEKIRHFIADFMVYIASDLKREPEPDEEERGE